MNKHLGVSIAVALLVGFGLGYWANSPGNNLGPIGDPSGLPSGHPPIGSESRVSDHSGTAMGNDPCCPEDSGVGSMGISGMAGEEAPLSDLEAAYNASPDDPEAATALARALRRSGENERAREILEDLLASNPDFPEANYEMGVLNLHGEGNEDEARRYLSRYVELAPDGENAELARRTIENIGNF